MTPTELLAVFRTEIADLSDPPLCSDALALGYIEDAQRQFCRKTEGIEDGRSFKLAVTPAKEWYALSPLITKLRKVTDANSGRELRVINVERMEAEGIRFDGHTGPIAALVTGIEKHTARAWPVPSVASTLNLSVFRLPKDFCASEDLEVDEQHARHLLLWAKHLVYDVQDSDLFDGRKSADYAQRFEAYCEQAKAEQVRARRVVGSVIYGGL